MNQPSRCAGNRHPERTVLYRVLFHYFERFLTEYERRFEKEYRYFRPVRHGQNGAELVKMDYLEFIGRVTSWRPRKAESMNNA